MTINSKHLLFVGSYVPEDQPGIHIFDFDTETGQTTPKGSFTGVANPSFLTLHPNGRWLYAVSETGLNSDGRYGAVCAFSIDDDGAALQLLNQQSTKGDWPCHVVLDHSGRWVMASNYGTGNAALYPIFDDGSLGEMSAFVQHEGSGPNTARQEGAHAHSAIFTPDNRFVIVADLGIDQLVIYKFDADSGTLDRHAAVQAQPGAGPRHLAFHANGRLLYAANELDSTVTVYRYDAEAGTAEPLQTLSTLPAADPESTVADIHLSNTANHLYVSNRGHNSVAAFELDQEGMMASLGMNSCGGNWPRNFALDSSGRYILVANRRSNDVVVMWINEDGAVGEVVGETAVSQPSCIRITAG